MNTPKSKASAATPFPQPTHQPFWAWWKGMLWRNPFFLASAALLLFGINRLSIDSNFLPTENANLTFNFYTLQVYEILLAVVAIFLARRRVWYDSTLLVVLESSLVLVPFILITQAVLNGRGMAAIMCLTGGALALIRFGCLKRFIPELNMPLRFLTCGGLILAVNVAVPFLYRSIMETDVARWQKPSYYFWFLLLPLLQLLANLLPRPIRDHDLAPKRSWLPLLMFELWIAATALNLWAIDYVSKLDFGPRLLAPTLWVLGWTIYNRLGDIVPGRELKWHGSLLVLPVLATVPSALHHPSQLFVALTALNVLLFAGLFVGKRHPQAAFQLFLVSLFALLGGIPEEWARLVTAEFSRSRGIALALSGYVVFQTTRSKRPEIGLGGAFMATLLPGYLLRGPSWHFSAQIGLVFLLLHSLRWIDLRHRGATELRWIAAMTWTAHSAVWTHMAGTTAMSFVSATAMIVLGFCVVTRWIRGERVPRSLPLSAVLCLLAAPSNALIEKLRMFSTGLLAIMGSFVLFGLGTAFALVRQRWSSPEASNQPPEASCSKHES